MHFWFWVVFLLVCTVLSPLVIEGVYKFRYHKMRKRQHLEQLAQLERRGTFCNNSVIQHQHSDRMMFELAEARRREYNKNLTGGKYGNTTYPNSVQ